MSQLLLLDAQSPDKDIKLFINSPGGSVTAGMGIYDAMMMCRADVQTVWCVARLIISTRRHLFARALTAESTALLPAPSTRYIPFQPILPRPVRSFGLAASMGAFLLGAGTKGKRYSMPNSRIMIHQPLGGASGAAVDIEIQAREIMYHKANLNRIMAEYTGQPVERIEEDTDRDRYMSPIEAKEYGIIDNIIGGDQATFKIAGDLSKFPKVRSLPPSTSPLQSSCQHPWDRVAKTCDGSRVAPALSYCRHPMGAVWGKHAMVMERPRPARRLARSTWRGATTTRTTVPAAPASSSRWSPTPPVSTPTRTASKDRQVLAVLAAERTVVVCI